jgi:hypothetical protein
VLSPRLDIGHGTSRASGTLCSSICVWITGSAAQEVSKGIRQATTKAVLILRRQRCFDFIEFLPDPAARFFKRSCPLVSFNDGFVERGIQLPKSSGGFFVGLGGCNCAISLIRNFVDPRFCRLRFVAIAPDGNTERANDRHKRECHIQPPIQGAQEREHQLLRSAIGAVVRK